MNKKTVQITDKQLIIFLVCKQFKVVKVERDPGGNRSIIDFENSEKLNQALLDYTNKESSVNIADYLSAEKRVNNILYFNKNRMAI
ncbi:DUF5659 domain-containing protein [Sporosalibacterium faouarense]|uniref:DUF5659 domain-containing protein n=1 Tax=Sporosalibacterium faouarense TaxID=516123 RepID=UPI00192C3E64|nr:DUF5659 domain-containing protein [Sporosalibacterium faouarense]